MIIRSSYGVRRTAKRKAAPFTAEKARATQPPWRLAVRKGFLAVHDRWAQPSHGSVVYWFAGDLVVRVEQRFG